MSRIFFSLFFLVRTFFYDIRRIFLCRVSHSSYERIVLIRGPTLSGGTCQTPVLWFQFSHKMNDENMDIDTSVGGNGSGESSISISYSKRM